MKQKDLLIWLLVGYGIYWFYKKKNTPVVTSAAPQNTNNVAPDTSNVMPTVAASDVNIKYAITGLRKFGNVPNTI
jgi:hypothetical protein